MNIKIVVAVIVIVAALLFGGISFIDSNVEYATLRTAMNTSKKVQIKGTWDRDEETSFDAAKGQFCFTIVDDEGLAAKVVLDGARPNNFELAEAVVVKGRYLDGYFHAQEILTKCPSKYEGDAETVKKTL